MVFSPEHVKNLRPYVAGKPIEELAREKGLDRIVKLASNENPLGPSPKAIEAATAAMARNHRYVDPGAYDLVRTIGQHLGVAPERIVCGAGTDSLLAYVVTAFSDAGDEILTSEGTFIGIYVNALKQGRTVRQVPLKDYRFDLTRFPDAITERTRIVYIANPNNPTGTIVTRRELDTFLAQLPPEVLVLLDEAYTSYAREFRDYPNGLSYDYPNLIVTRTFSKDYGLAGLRVGFAVGPEDLIRRMYKVKLPFEPSLPAQMAAAASLADTDYIERSVTLNRRSLDRMAAKLAQLNVTVVPSCANFLLMLFDNEQQAADFNAACLDRGLILRHVKGFGIPNGVRINSGTDDETDFALEVIADVCHTLNLTPAASNAGRET